MSVKDSQIQIRVSSDLKAVLQASAAREGQELSAWILNQLVPSYIERWFGLCEELSGSSSPRSGSHIFAEIHDLLVSIGAEEMSHLMRFPPHRKISPDLMAYLASMLEYTAHVKKVHVPSWVSETPPLQIPFFASSLMSLRTHLLAHTPAAYRKRNIFVDSPVGSRV